MINFYFWINEFNQCFNQSKYDSEKFMIWINKVIEANWINLIRFLCKEIFKCNLYLSFKTEYFPAKKKWPPAWKNGSGWIRDQENIVDILKSHITSQWVSAVSSSQNIAKYFYEAKLNLDD